MKSFIKKLTPVWVLYLYHRAWPVLAVVIYRFPSKRIKIIGVSGTNGKTTVVHLATHILESAGFKVASLSSLRFKIDHLEWKNTLKMTMPGRLKMQKFLRQAVGAKCDYVVMEVTSEGIKQNRHRFINFDTVVFTNLTPEHIESHGSFEKYKETKGKFFALPHLTSIVNIDDENAGYFLNFVAENKITYSTDEDTQAADAVLAEEVELGENGVLFKVDGVQFDVPMPGKFNIYNSLAAICIGLSQKLKLENIAKYLETFTGVPGRMERVIGEPFVVVVDYAHTPDAMNKVYKTVKDQMSQPEAGPHTAGNVPAKGWSASGGKGGRMLCVFGATGGGRDKWKRPKFARIAQNYCDEIILTDEDPYDENPEAILEDIEQGFSSKFKSYIKVLDRRKAINKALQIAKDGDFVIVTGKGAEPIMMIKGGAKKWDDRSVVREEFAKLYF